MMMRCLSLVSNKKSRKTVRDLVALAFETKISCLVKFGEFQTVMTIYSRFVLMFSQIQGNQRGDIKNLQNIFESSIALTFMPKMEFRTKRFEKFKPGNFI